MLVYLSVSAMLYHSDSMCWLAFEGLVCEPDARRSLISTISSEQCWLVMCYSFLYSAHEYIIWEQFLLFHGQATHGTTKTLLLFKKHKTAYKVLMVAWFQHAFITLLVFEWVQVFLLL